MPKKYDPETRREMQYKRQKAWYEKNKEHMREYRKARYEKLKADRLCVVCRKPMGDDPHCYCESCREYQKKVYNNRNAVGVDAVEIDVVKKWLYAIAMNNVGQAVEDMAAACEEIASRLDGLRRFAEERRGEDD